MDSLTENEILELQELELLEEEYAKKENAIEDRIYRHNSIIEPLFDTPHSLFNGHAHPQNKYDRDLG